MPPKIYGNLKPEDDYTHPVGPEENFNESVYFNFFDRAANRGGFVRMGNRPNEGYAEMTVIVWNPDGSAFFNYKRPKIDNNDGWNAGGLTVEVVTPAEVLTTRYDGEAVYLADPRDMQDPGRAFKDNPMRPIVLDLTHSAVGPLYGHVGDPDDGNQFARAHFEQHMKVTGNLTLDGETVAVNGYGLRDHSWGPRYWQSTPSYRWITGNFGDDLGMIVRTNGDGEGGGLLHRGQELIRIEKAVVTTEYQPGSRFHRSLEARLELENGETHQLAGTVKGFIPLRNRRAGANTHIGEGMTEYVLDGERTGYGLSEYLDNA